MGFPGGLSDKELTCQRKRHKKQKTGLISLGWQDALEEGTSTHSSILARRIPRTEEPGQL